MKFPMKLSLTALLAVGLGVILLLSFEAQGQRRTRSFGRTDNTYGGSAGAPGVPPTPAFEATKPAAPTTPPAAPPSATSAPATRPAPAAVDSTEPLAPIMHGKPLPADYQVLLRKSIFDKDRRAGRPYNPADYAPRPAMVRRPSVPVLVGYISGDDGYIAYIEDPDSGKLWPFAPGDLISPEYGYVAEVTVDNIEVAKEGSPPHRVAYGQNLNGETPAAPSYSSLPMITSVSPAQTASTTAGAATLPAGAAGGADLSGLSIEEKMKLRRLQQMGQ